MELKFNTLNTKIHSFYSKNPKINFEQINLLFIEIFEKSNTTLLSDFQKQITDFIATNSNETGENILEIILNKIIPTSEVIKNKNDQICCDYILRRDNKPNIMIESKICKTNINNDITNIFIETIKKNNQCGIFISQHSGILNKCNYHIETYNENIIVFIQNCEYSVEKIKNAIEIIDNLYYKLKQLRKENNYVIDKETLNEINSEYQLFINKKTHIIDFAQEYHTNLIKQIEGLQFKCLDNYLSSKIDFNKKVGIYKCDLCNIYTSNKLKGMSAHKRGCKKKVHI